MRILVWVLMLTVCAHCQFTSSDVSNLVDLRRSIADSGGDLRAIVDDGTLTSDDASLAKYYWAQCGEIIAHCTYMALVVRHISTCDEVSGIIGLAQDFKDELIITTISVRNPEGISEERLASTSSETLLRILERLTPRLILFSETVDEIVDNKIDFYINGSQ